MNLYLRLLRLLLMLPFISRRGALAESRMSFRVLPTDCDVNFHMNNGRYLTLMDLGRVHLLAQTGLLRHLIRQGLKPVLSAAEINFIRALRPLQKFELVTRVLTWDEKYVYLEQRFEADGELYAVATVRGLFLRRRRPVDFTAIVGMLGVAVTAPPMPAVVRHWKELTALKKERSARGA